MKPLRTMSLVLFLAVLAVCPGYSGDKDWKPIQITWHGQSFFEIKSSKGTNVVIDPHMILEYGRVQGVKADVVLISHNHNDHTQVGVNFEHSLAFIGEDDNRPSNRGVVYGRYVFQYGSSLYLPPMVSSLSGAMP